MISCVCFPSCFKIICTEPMQLYLWLIYGSLWPCTTLGVVQPSLFLWMKKRPSEIFCSLESIWASFCCRSASSPRPEKSTLNRAMMESMIWRDTEEPETHCYHHIIIHLRLIWTHIAGDNDGMLRYINKYTINDWYDYWYNIESYIWIVSSYVPTIWRLPLPRGILLQQSPTAPSGVHLGAKQECILRLSLCAAEAALISTVKLISLHRYKHTCKHLGIMSRHRK